MKAKTLIPFIVILMILLGVIAYQKMTEEPPAPIAVQIGLEPLVPDSLTPATLRRIELYAGEEPDDKVLLEHDGNEWRITSLFNAPVNQDTLDGFLDKMLELQGEPRATAADEARLADFALTDEEAFHVLAYAKDAETPDMHLLFGKSADFRTVFLRKAGDSQVYVEATNLRREAGASDSGPGAVPKPNRWLQTRLLELDTEQISRVTLQYPDKALMFERHEVVLPAPETPETEEETLFTPEQPEVTYEWALASGGFSDVFNDTELQSLLNRFANLSITTAVDPEKKADWGFEPPQYRVTLALEGGEDVVLYGGRDKPGGATYVQLAGAEPALIYEISKFNFEQIFPQGSKLFTLPAWNVDEDLMARIEIERPDSRIILAREGEVWRIIEPEIGLEIQKTAVDNLVSAAASLTPADYTDEAVSDFDTTINIRIGADMVRTLHLGPPSKHMDGHYVRFDNASEVLALARADMEKLTPPVRDLYALSVLDFNINEIARIHVAHSDMDLTLVRDETDDFAWERVLNGQTAEAMHNDVEELVYTLNDFQVDNFLLERDVASVQAVTAITVTQRDGALLVLEFSAETDGAHEATLSGLPHVFSVLSTELDRILDELEPFKEIPEEPAQEEDAVTLAPEAEVPDADDVILPVSPEIIIPDDVVEVTLDEATVSPPDAELEPVFEVIEAMPDNAESVVE